MEPSENLKPLDYKQLGESIRSVFTESDKYVFDKHIPTLTIDGKYVGDIFEKCVIEPCGDRPPIFYLSVTPYDEISRKTTYYAVIFEAGELVFAAPVKQFVHQRTGVMTPLIMSTLGITQLTGKKVLIVGTGNLARRALAAFKAYYPELGQVDFINSGEEPAEFLELAGELKVTAERGDLQHLGDYDVIVCHSSTPQPILTPEMVSHIKPGAFISSFASEDHMELAPDFLDTSQARVIVDWDQTAAEAVDLAAALKKGLAKKDALIKLRDVFNGDAPDEDKKYTVYRSHGTPMQDLAFLKLLKQK